MSLFCDALQQFIPQSIANAPTSKQFETFSEIILKTRHGFDLTIDDSSHTLTLDYRNADLVAEAVSADCARFACASFQTASEAEIAFEKRENIAWGLIKLYYSAFYAGHSTIRLFGETCSHFNKSHINRLTLLMKATDLSPAFKVDTGLYRCALSPSLSGVSCAKAGGSNGGTHEIFWAAFGQKLKTIRDSVLAGPLSRVESQTVFAKLDDMLAILDRISGFSSLSGTRNDIQYRLLHGVWYPGKLKERTRERIHSVSADWAGDPMKIDLGMQKDQISTFVAACIFVISLCKALVVRVSERSAAGKKSFIRPRAINYLNSLGV